jgi:RND superfamily putative drug exporter
MVAHAAVRHAGGMLRSIASFSVRHRALVVVIWLVAAVGAATAAAASFGGEFADDGRLPGTDSQRAYDLFREQFPAAAVPGEDTATMVFEDGRGLADPQVAAAIGGFVADLRALPGVTGATSPEQGGQVSTDGTVGAAEVAFDHDDTAVIGRITAAADELRATGTQVDFASGWFSEGSLPASEAFGLLAAAVVLLIAFGSVVAMGLPLLTALIGVAIGLAGVSLWSAVLDTPDFTVQVAAMMGIGVGIDYALFIVTRHRDALARRGDVHDAAVEAIDTAGRAVLFAGTTVMVSLLGMFLMGLSFLYGLAAASSTAVLVAMLAAVTLVPALLGIIGHRLDRWSIHRRRHTGENVWHRWSRFVQRHPKACAIAGVTVLLALAAPVLAMRLASADLGNDPVGTTTRTAYDRLAAGFGPGVNGPLLLVSPSVDTAPLLAALDSTPGVAAVLPSQVSPSGGSVVQVIPATGPQDEATTALVHRLRDVTIPGSGVTAFVGGQTASDVDFADHLSSRLPIFIGSVLAFSFVLLLLVFRSILVPLKAVVLNLLSIGAAYGVMVMVFQWGWLGGLIGVTGGAPIEPWAPMLLFAIVFGLSMDYEVFLLSSIRERHDHGMSNSDAVVEGLAATGRVITAAAAIMVLVFGSFIAGDLRAVKLIGLGLSVAVLVDATVVRMLLVPATMELLGDRNWWLPRRLAKVLPRMAGVH